MKPGYKVRIHTAGDGMSEEPSGSSWTIQATAPAKTILLGEYAVLYGNVSP